MQDYDTLWAILYVSNAMKDLSASDVEYYLNLNRQSRIENDITGIVILAENNVLVLQEGIKEKVQAAFEQGKKHPAQHSMVKLFDGPIIRRYFEGFPLAFKTLGNPNFKHLDNFSDFSQQEYLDELLKLNDSVSKLIKTFIKTNG